MSLFNDVFSSFFTTDGKKKTTTPVAPTLTPSPDMRQSTSASESNNQTVQFGMKTPVMTTIGRSGKTTDEIHRQKLYSRQPSFIDHLPYAEFLPEEGVMLFDDAKSAGAVFELKPIGTEGRGESYLNRVRTLVKDALQDSFDELDNYPYVVQFYCQDEKDLSFYIENLRHYIKTVSPEAHGSAFTEAWLKTVAQHLKAVGKPGGLFIDDRVTNTAWAGKVRKTRMVIYRYVGAQETDNIERLNNACDRIQSALSTAGLTVDRQNEEQIYQWLLRWFNPNPSLNFNLDNNTCYHLMTVPKSDDLPFEFQDFSENLFYNPPETKNGYWYFDGQPHDVIVVDNIRKQPQVGHMTGEVVRGRNINALFDLLPESTIMVNTLVIHPQDKLQAHLDLLSRRAVGKNYESIYLKQDAITVTDYLKDGHKLYQGAIVFYVTGKDEQELKHRAREIRTILLSNNLVPVREGLEVAALNTYLRWLPMNFNPQLDAKSHFYTKYYWVQHMANLLPVFGRETGTGHPGITYFNRGGAPLDFDPLNPKDRTKNAHKLILGPTGSGKSATLTAQMSQLVAVHRPRTFIVEAGNSFGLFADYAERYGLTVNRVSLEPSSNVVLPLFAEAHKLLEMDVEIDVDDDDDENEGEGEEQRDLLAEMELTARLMITGGEAKEDDKMSRADRSAIRQAILLAAQKTSKMTPPRQVLAGDVKAALEELSRSATIRPERGARLADMAEAMDMFCTGVNGRFFNREGEIWPEADITLVDLAMFAREGYEAELAIAYISLINHINSLGEKYQHSFRPIVNITDESHIITVNPLLAKFLVKGSKMWRKLGIWLWLATQNMTDFPDESDKLLSMIEWWELLNLSNDEVEQVNRFRRLTEAQKQMLLSAKKSDKKYTEGVVLATNMEALFRVVPPSLYLALGMTEKHEKAQRKQLMMTHHCSELDAALMVAQDLDKKRGIALND